jgi:hypothetical protein
MKLLFLHKHSKNFIFFQKIIAFIFIFLAFINYSFAIDYNYENCSLNPINECFLNSKLRIIDEQITQLRSQIIASRINPVYIFAQINTTLIPTRRTGPTDYVGDGIVTLTITNNSPLPINISCDGYISMKGFSGSSITDIAHLVITKKYINISSASTIPSDGQKGYVINQNTGIISSINTTLAKTLWGAALGTESNEPLDCKVSFLTSSGIDETMHVFISLPYS